MVTLPSGQREITTTWEHFRFAPDGDYGTTQGVVSHDFWVSFFFICGFFLHYPCTNAYFVLQLCFQLPKTYNHQDHTFAVFNRNAHKVIKDAISYARIQANNQYYKEILGQKVNKEMGSSSIYLTEEQYCQVKNHKSFDLQCLRLIFI
jgi:hypothetical protein